jgi:hypothetical protein
MFLLCRKSSRPRYRGRPAIGGRGAGAGFDADNLSAVEDRAQLDDVPARSRTGVGGIVAIVGGALIAVGTLFELVTATVGPAGRNQLQSSQTYLDTDDGKTVLVLGVIVIVLAVVTLLRPSRNVIWPIVVAACSLAALGIAIHDRVDLNNLAGEIRDRFARSDAATGIVHVTIGPAVYIAIAGGVVATVGAILAARDAR